ncbi:MAG: ROK family protein [Thomasclavelia sp.]|jgi:predicted NBD/HSP70 family sugar kinase|nr:ROK family protein [Thomasclavelia sp.]
MYFVADIGGSSTKIAIMNQEGEIKHRDSLDRQDDFDGLVDVMVECFKKYDKEYDLEGIAISAPGSVDCKTGVIGGMSALPYIHGPNFKEIFKEKCGVNVAIENDANCAGLAEGTYGKYKDKETLALLVIGTGVGGCVVFNHQVVHGAHLFGGEFGFNVVDYDENSNKCLHLSDSSAFGGMLRNAKEHGVPASNGKELFECASHDKNAKKIIDDFYRYLCINIFNLQTILDPDVILISGAISQRKGLIDELSKAYHDLFKDDKFAILEPTIEISTFVQDANLVGALANYLEEYK